jgi:hypothetical protein
MLLGNYSVLYKSAGKFIGGGAIGLGLDRSAFNLTNASRNRFISGSWAKQSGVPDGYRPPYAWVLPSKAGGLSARNNLSGVGTITLTMASGLNADASLTGSGDLTGTGQLIISMVAALTGSGTINNAAMEAFLNLAASLAGSGDISGAATAIGHAAAALEGDGDLAAVLNAIGTMAAEIVVTGGVLTAADVAQTVWESVLSNYPTAGTAGNTLALAGSGGVDYGTLATAVWSNATRSLTVTGLSAGDAEKLLHIWRLLGLDSSNPVTTTTADISATDIAIDITGNGETSTTLTRA